MSLTDVGLQFKMTGADSFQSKMSELGSTYKSLSATMDKAPNVNKHFNTMANGLHAAANKINTSFKLIGAGLAALATAKGLGAGFDWAIGSSEMSRAMSKVRMAMTQDEVSAYQAAAENMRKSMVVDKPAAMDAAYQINSAAANKPLEDRLEIFKLMPHYAKLLNMNLEEAAQFFKGINASFGQFLTPDKQKTFASDLLGVIQGANKDTAADPKLIAQAFSHAAPVYQELGLSLKHMTADMAFLIPALGNRAEMAGVALRNVYSRAGAAYGKLQAAEAKGAFIEKYLPRTPWKNESELNAAAKMGNEQAKKFKESMKLSSDWAKDEGNRISGELAKQGRWDELFGKMSVSAEAIKKQKGDSIGKLKDALGEETMVPLLSLLKAYHDKKIDETRKAVNVSGEAAKNTIETQGMGDIYQKWGLVKQAAEGLAWNLREILQAPLDTLLTAWKDNLLEYKRLLGGEGKSGAVAQGVRDFFGGGAYGYTKQVSGQAAADQQGSLDDAIKDFIKSLGTGGWRETGIKLGQAVGEFAEVMGQLKQIIGTVFKLLSPLMTKESALPLAAAYGAAKIMPGGPQAKLAAGAAAYGAADLALNGKNVLNLPPIKNEYAPGYPFAAPGSYNPWNPDLTQPAHRSATPTPDLLQPAHAPGQVQGQFNGTLESNITVNIDGEQVANAVVPKLIDKIKGIVEGLLGDGRDNATGSMWK